MFAKHFIAAYQQVGDFKVVKVGNQVQKNGGNVASHFLTPSGHVIHSVTGPVNATVLYEEARWALDAFEKAKAKEGDERLMCLASAHEQASHSPVSGQDRRVHELLASRPMPHLQSVYREIFEDILGQRVSKAGPRLAQAAVRLKYAKEKGSPILFVLHDGNTWSNPAFGTTTQQLIQQYVVIVMPLRESPALSQLTEQPPFEASGSARPLFVVTRSDCRQLSSISGWNETALAVALADGWADALERDPPNIRTLVRAQRLLKKANPSAAQRVREVTIQVQQKQREERELAKKETEEISAT